MIVKRPDGYCVYSEDGTKKLGGPYKTEDEANERLRQVEAAKAAKTASLGGGKGGDDVASLLPKKKGTNPGGVA